MSQTGVAAAYAALQPFKGLPPAALLEKHGEIFAAARRAEGASPKIDWCIARLGRVGRCNNKLRSTLRETLRELGRAANGGGVPRNPRCSCRPRVGQRPH